MTAPVLLDEIAGLLGEITGEEAKWSAALGPQTRLDGDLFVDSVELAALSDALCRRFGRRVDLAGHIADLDLDGIIALSLGDVAALVVAHADPLTLPPEPR
jgi:acyl carrier protein